MKQRPGGQPPGIGINYTHRTRESMAKHDARIFNRRNPVGSPVMFTRGGLDVRTRVRRAADVVNGEAVVWLDALPGTGRSFIPVRLVRPQGEADG